MVYVFVALADPLVVSMVVPPHLVVTVKLSAVSPAADGLVATFGIYTLTINPAEIGVVI